MTPWTTARQAPLSMGFSRQEHWSGLLFPSSGDLPDSGTESASPALAGGFFTTEPLAKPNFHGISHLFLYRQHPSLLSHLFFYTPIIAKSTLLTSYLGSWCSDANNAIKNLGSSWWLSGKEYACQGRRYRFDPWSGRIPHVSEQLSPCASTIEPVL